MHRPVLRSLPVPGPPCVCRIIEECLRYISWPLIGAPVPEEGVRGAASGATHHTLIAVGNMLHQCGIVGHRSCPEIGIVTKQVRRHFSDSVSKINRNGNRNRIGHCRDIGVFRHCSCPWLPSGHEESLRVSAVIRLITQRVGFQIRHLVEGHHIVMAHHLLPVAEGILYPVTDKGAVPGHEPRPVSPVSHQPVRIRDRSVLAECNKFFAAESLPD